MWAKVITLVDLQELTKFFKDISFLKETIKSVIFLF
jgi:hypothetical protein